MVGVKRPAVFNRVEEHFTKCHADRASFRIRQLGHLVKKLEYSISGLKITAGANADPLGGGRDHFDPIIPAWSINGVLNHDG